MAHIIMQKWPQIASKNDALMNNNKVITRHQQQSNTNNNRERKQNSNKCYSMNLQTQTKQPNYNLQTT
jgi:hypothetical protein